MKDLAVYLHIPFCAKRCAYCHFQIKVLHPRSDQTAFHARFERRLIAEIRDRAASLRDYRVRSVFYGGGTPSQLGAATLGRIQAALREAFSVDADCEVSLEVNPEDVVPGFFEALLGGGFNRISFGVQSFHDSSLRAVGRIHNRAGALEALQAVPPFPKGMSFDLILGLPHQTAETLAQDLDFVAALKPEHIAIYMLERDLPTSLDKTAEHLPMPSEDDQAAFYETICARLGKWGYDHYEISNFALPGYACRHNLVYWRCGDYLGLGPAAVGRLDTTFQLNHERLSDWEAAVVATGRGIHEEVTWTRERLHQEKLVQGMRLREGVPRTWLSPEQWVRLSDCFDAGLLQQTETRLALTARGRLLGNEVFQVFVEDA